MATAVVPVTRRPAARIDGHPRVYCEKKNPWPWPLNHGQKNVGVPPSVGSSTPWRSAAGLPYVDRLVTVPRIGGEHPVVHRSTDQHREQSEQRELANSAARARGRRPWRPRWAPRSWCSPQPRAQFLPRSRRPKLVASPGTAGFLPDRPSRIIARMTQTTTTAPPTPPRRPSRRRDAVETVLLAVLAYVPFLLSSPGRGRRRHQAVSLPRPRPLPFAGGVVVGSARGRGNCPPPADRLPVPDGAVLLAHGHGGCARLGGPAAVARHHLSLAALGRGWLFRMLGVRRTGALAGALVYMLTPYQLAFTARISVLLLAVGGASLAGRPHDPRGAQRRLARPGHHRPGRPERRQRERGHAPARR